MFFCRKNPLLHVLFLLLGIKFLKRDRWSDEEKTAYRLKRKAFRQKMREAFDVWDDTDDSSTTESDAKSSTES